MPHRCSPQLRGRSALVVVVYACVLLGVPLLHHAAVCHDAPNPHCTLCAYASAVPLVAAPAPIVPELAEGGEVGPQAAGDAPVVAARTIPTRAPPSGR